MITIIKNSSTDILDLNILKSHLRIEHEHEDQYLKIIGQLATDVLEKAMGVSILKKKYKYIGPMVTKLPIQPVIKICSQKDNETIFYAGITDSPNGIPSDIKYAILQIAKNIYECNDENILESKYIKHIINNYKQIAII